MSLIQCLTPFKKGTKLPVGSRVYNFLPNKFGDYVADVVEDDVPTVLSISAGYQLYSRAGGGQVRGDAIEYQEPQKHPAARAQPQMPGRKPAGFGAIKNGNATQPPETAES